MMIEAFMAGAGRWVSGEFTMTTRQAHWMRRAGRATLHVLVAPETSSIDGLGPTRTAAVWPPAPPRSAAVDGNGLAWTGESGAVSAQLALRGYVPAAPPVKRGRHWYWTVAPMRRR